MPSQFETPRIILAIHLVANPTLTNTVQSTSWAPPEPHEPCQQLQGRLVCSLSSRPFAMWRGKSSCQILRHTPFLPLILPFSRC